MNQTQDRCPACGGLVAGGRAGCQSLFDELGAQAYADVRRAALHDLVVDTYSMQHPETYCVSAKSYAAHLTRLCCGLEHKGDPTTYAAIPRWLNGRSDLIRPDAPRFRGGLTIVKVHAAKAEDYDAAVRGWARDVWDAYAAQHALAREWVASALRSGPRRR